MQADFFKAGFQVWMPGTMRKRALLGPQTHIYNLIRSGASENAEPFPWELIVQKKILKVKGVEGAIVTKAVSCSRPVMGNNLNMSATKFCCVQKTSYGPPMLSTKEQEAVLDAIMKI